jgi:hypothetical protein
MFCSDVVTSCRAAQAKMLRIISELLRTGAVPPCPGHVSENGGGERAARKGLMNMSAVAVSRSVEENWPDDTVERR